MPQEQLSWRHHYIPEFYLKQWANAEGRLTQFSKPYRDTVVPKRVYPRQTGFVDRLYILQGVPEEQADVYERLFLSPVDSRAADVLRKLKDGVTSFNAAERSAWSRFLLSLMIRHPQALAAMRERLATAALDIDPATERQYRRRRLPHEPPTLREALAQPRNVNAIAHRTLDVLRATADNPRIGAHLINMRWGQITFPYHAPALLTSDRPLIWAYGLRHPDCEIFLPLGPKAAFYACNTVAKDVLIRSVAAPSLAAYINEQVVRRAQDYVYGLSDVHQAYVQQHMGIDPEFTMAEALVRNIRPTATA